MTSLSQYHLSILLLFILSFCSLSAQGDRDEERRPQISLAGEMLPLSHWFQHVPPSLVDFRGIVLTEAPTITYHPVLPYIFFDSASTQIPDRYVLYDSPVADGHDPGPVCAEDLACHYHVLNIIGARLRRHPDLAVTIVGYNTESRGGEDSSHSEGRAGSVREYLYQVWGIALERMILKGESGSPMYLHGCIFRWPCPHARRVEMKVDVSTHVEEDGRSLHALRDSLNRLLFVPTIDTTSRHTAFPSVIFLKLDSGFEKSDVVDQYLEVRYNRRHVDRLEDIHHRNDSIPYFLLRAVQGVIGEEEGVLDFTLVVLSIDGTISRSNELQIPVMIVPESQSREVFATERTIVRGRLISGLWHEDPDQPGAVAQGTINLLREHRQGRSYRLSALASVDSSGQFDRRLRYSHLVALTYRRALRASDGEGELESQAIGLASGGLLGFSLPEERVIGESTYIELDFPRCVDSVEVGECRFDPEYIHPE